MSHSEFPVEITMDHKTYQINAIRTLKDGTRIAWAKHVHPTLGKLEVSSPSILIRLANMYQKSKITAQ